MSVDADDALSRAAGRWRLDRDLAFLNHGAFGACPEPVLAEQDRWRRRMERNPVAFLDREIMPAIAQARSRVAAFLHAEAAGFAFVPNVTTAVSCVLASLDLSPGDEIVATSHGYSAVAHALALRAAATGATLRTVSLGLEPKDDDAIADTVAELVTDRTALVVVDQVTSPTGMILPAARIVADCRARGVATLVDGAHAPGMLDVDVDSLGADYWCGNFHKWLCAPKGSGGLWVAARHRERVRPLVVSHAHLSSFHDAFDWPGTHDPTSHLSVPAAIEMFDGLGWDRIRSHNRALAEQGRALVAASIGAGRIVGEPMQSAMAVVPLPPAMPATREAARELVERLYAEKIEVAVPLVEGRALVRVSAMLYNRPEDFERLAEALPRTLEEARFG